MKDNLITVDMPIGQCKTTRYSKSYTHGDMRIYTHCRTEERRSEDTDIIEKERTKIIIGEKETNILNVNTVNENGIITKITESIYIKNNDDTIGIRRRRRVSMNGDILADISMEKEENIPLFHINRNAFEQHGFCGIEKE